MKHIKLYEDFNRESDDFENKFVGIHCSPKSLKHDDFYGKILDEYYMCFKQILELVKFDYKEAKELLNKIELLEDELSLENDSVDLVYDIVEFFTDNDLEWIFVSKGDAMTKYGENCYNVYFKDLKNVYSMQDELTDGAMIYIYNSKTDKPIIKNIDDEAY